MQVEGYPQFVLLLVLGSGVFLAMVRPYWAFLFGLFLITAGHTGKFNQTRLTGLGPYLNLADACVLIAFAGFFFETIAAKRPVRLPQIVPLIICVLIASAAQTLWKLGWTYETIRALRWSLQLPVFFFLGTNMVTSAERARTLVGILLAAAIMAALQHLFLASDMWSSQSLSMESYQAMRTISYWGGGMASTFLLTAIAWRVPGNLNRRFLYLTAGFLFLGTLFLNQTRSIWFATVGSIPWIVVVFRSSCPVRRSIRFIAGISIICIVSVCVVHRAMPGFNVLEMVAMRMTLLTSDNPESRAHMGTRERAFMSEVDAWLNGTLVAGRGLYFFQTVESYESDYTKAIAFGHLGYVTYLSQLGIIGLVVYAVYLPLGVIRGSRYLWLHATEHAVRYLALLGGASIIFMSLMFVMSSQFLSPGFEASGVLYGAIWSLSKSLGMVCPRN